jgi:hypothetical protein
VQALPSRADASAAATGPALPSIAQARSREIDFAERVAVLGGRPGLPRQLLLELHETQGHVRPARREHEVPRVVQRLDVLDRQATGRGHCLEPAAVEDGTMAEHPL